MCVCVCLCVCLFVCLFVCFKERERGGVREGERDGRGECVSGASCRYKVGSSEIFVADCVNYQMRKCY